MRRLLNDLAELGCEEVHLGGGGEPMIYPKIMEALELIKSLGMGAFITSNITPITEKRVDRLVELQVDRFYASIWAATPETYAITHPNANEDVFRKIDRTLRYLYRKKGGNRLAKPQMMIHHVIFAQNHGEVRKMVDYALEVGAAAVQFTLAYTFPGATDGLLLNESMRADVLGQLEEIPEAIHALEGHHGPGSFLWEIDNFKRRLREDSAGQGDYDQSVLERIPCQIGWFYAIIQADGVVIPCCKGQSKPMGNVKETPFREIWESRVYNIFRQRAKNLPKSDPYFASINCYKMCDNVQMLCKIEERMERLRPFEWIARRVVLPVIKKIGK
jgi:MoaA/NifB/PqqE/SkfB family radical SAM enzyme